MSEQFKQIFNLVNTAILVFDQQGCCSELNESCETLLSTGRKQLLGKTLQAVFEFNNEIIELAKQSISQDIGIVMREVELHLPQWQRSMLIDVNMTPNSASEKQALVLELHDRKNIKKIKQDAELIDKFKVATQLIRGLCHEIKNPLGGIRGAAQLLQMDINIDKKVASNNAELLEYTQVIIHEVDRLDDLLSKMSTEEHSVERLPVNVHDLLTHNAQLLMVEYNGDIRFQYDFDTSLPSVIANQNQLSQVMLNLLKNAAQWSLIGNNNHVNDKKITPQINIKTRVAFPDLLRSQMPGRGLRIQILDNGPGVDASVRDQLFFPMVSAREAGTGLGLSISQEIAQNHGGFIELDQSHEQNQKKVGASFSFYLPFDA